MDEEREVGLLNEKGTEGATQVPPGNLHPPLTVHWSRLLPAPDDTSNSLHQT